MPDRFLAKYCGILYLFLWCIYQLLIIKPFRILLLKHDAPKSLCLTFMFSCFKTLWETIVLTVTMVLVFVILL